LRGKTETILILGGTKEAAALAAELVSTRPEARIITSLAGRTKEPRPVAGEVRIGGFGGANGLASYMLSEGITQLIDATHPFALKISANAKRASELGGVPLTVRTRMPWKRRSVDDWVKVKSLEEARDAIPANSRVLLALGSQHIGIFGNRADVHFIVRMVDRPQSPLQLVDHELIIGMPGNVAAEEALLGKYGITHIVCRNSGGDGAYAKIEAARKLGITVIMVSRAEGEQTTRDA
jgi:precorrin-6A/cobalt-precorrin-6A reductase